MLGGVGIGARQQESDIGDVGVCGPHLLPVDYPLVTVAGGTGAQRRQVAARLGFAEQLTPQVAEAADPWQQLLLLRAGAVPHQRCGHQVVGADGARYGRGRQFLVEDVVADRVAVILTTPLPGPVQADEVFTEKACTPCPVRRHVAGSGAARAWWTRHVRSVGGDVGAQSLPELQMSIGELDVHD